MKKRGLIVHFSDFTLPGGVNKVVYESLKNLSRHDINVDLAQPFPPSLEVDGDFEILDECFTGKMGLLFNVAKFVNKVDLITKKYDYSFVVVHGHLTTCGHRIAKKIKNNVGKIILHPHYDNYVETALAKPLFPIFNKIVRFWVLGKYDNIIVGSEFEKCAFTEDVGRAETTVIPLGINSVPRNRVRCLSENIEIVFSGHLIKRKRVDTIIEVVSELSKFENLRPKLKIIGEGNLKRKLEELSTKLNISHLIEWREFLSKDEMLDEVYKSDLFMLFSESEAFAITVAECLGQGTPCIVVDRTALSEHAVEDGCILVDYPVNPKKVAHEVKSLVGKTMKVGLRGKRVKPWEDVIQSYLEVYLS